MAVLRNPNRNKFTVVDNYALQDENLSLKARGLLVTMLSLPDNWQFSENGLCSIFQKDGQASIRSGLKELEENGYMVRTRKRDNLGRVSSVEWTICDYPHLENPSVVNPNLENLPQLNTNKSNTESIEELNNIPEPKKTEKKKFSARDCIESYTQDAELRDLLHEWLEIRKKKRAPETEGAITRNLEKLPDLARQSGLSLQDYMQEVIRRGWQAFYPVRDAKPQQRRNDGRDFDWFTGQ